MKQILGAGIVLILIILAGCEIKTPEVEPLMVNISTDIVGKGDVLPREIQIISGNPAYFTVLCDSQHVAIVRDGDKELKVSNNKFAIRSYVDKKIKVTFIHKDLVEMGRTYWLRLSDSTFVNGVSNPN
ncbi:MAG: hypothetical protein WAO52_10490 [Prolixibacteraceae bacterium]